MALVGVYSLQNIPMQASNWRTVLSSTGLVQAGVFAPSQFKITQTSTASLFVQIASGICAVPSLVSGIFYFVENSGAITSGGVGGSAGHASLPRIDCVILKVTDKTDMAGATDGASIVIRPGTATSGATLDNRSGAPTVGVGETLLADILVPAAATTYTSANIRDRRGWAQGACITNYANNGGGGTITSTAGTSLSSVLGMALGIPRIELNPANLIELSISAEASNSTAGANVGLYLTANTVTVMASLFQYGAANQVFDVTPRRILQPNALAGGTVSQSFLFDIIGVVSGGTGTILNTNNAQLYYSIREIISGQTVNT